MGSQSLSTFEIQRLGWVWVSLVRSLYWKLVPFCRSDSTGASFLVVLIPDVGERTKGKAHHMGCSTSVGFRSFVPSDVHMRYVQSEGRRLFSVRPFLLTPRSLRLSLISHGTGCVSEFRVGITTTVSSDYIRQGYYDSPFLSFILFLNL